jgi:hypothetical protein
MSRFTALVFGSLCAFAVAGAPLPSRVADQAIVLSPDLPATVAVPQQNPDLAQLQTDFDVFSWQTFVALNWPARSNGTPNTDVRIGQQGALTQSVWETWKEPTEVFKDDGSEPSPWNAPNRTVPPECAALTSPDGGKVLAHLAKKPDVLFSSTQPFATGPLIDQNGQFARFEISLNRSMFDYIVGNVLYNKQGQQTFAKAGKEVGFACTGATNATTDTGAIMVKAAWKILGAGDDRTRFYTRKALVWTPGSTNPVRPATCAVSDVGMIGLHIATKVKDTPQWVWSTFEHRSNVPDLSSLPAKLPYSFYNQDCKDCTAVNKPPPRPWDPTKPGQPTQIARVTPIDAPTVALNKSWQAALASVNPASPWQYYDLISTQWPTQTSNGCNALSETSPAGNPAPQFLANSTLESYIQSAVPNVSSSCIECHMNAAATTGKFSDFTYMLSMAKSAVNPATAAPKP